MPQAFTLIVETHLNSNTLQQAQGERVLPPQTELLLIRFKMTGKVDRMH